MEQTGETDDGMRCSVLEWYRGIVLHNGQFSVSSIASTSTTTELDVPLQPVVMLMRMMRCVMEDSHVRATAIVTWVSCSRVPAGEIDAGKAHE